MPLQKLTLRIGFWAAVFNIVGGIAYLAILVIVVATSTPMSDAGAFPLVAVSMLLLIGPLGLVPLWAAIHLSTAEEKRVLSLISLIFTILFSATTSINRWVHLTVVRQSLAANVTQGLDWFTPYGQHSIMFALEMLGYGWFLGFALVSLAPVFGGRSTRLARSLFWAFLISGSLCLIGALGKLTEISALLMVGMAGWALGLGLISVLLAVWFCRLDKNTPG
jgi:hypothetical protein